MSARWGISAQARAEARVILAFALSPIVAGIVALAIVGSFGGHGWFNLLWAFEAGQEIFYEVAIAVLLGGAMFGVTYGMVTMIAVGLPVHRFMMSRKRVAAWQYSLAGAAVNFALAVVWALILGITAIASFNLGALLAWLASGVAAGFAAGLLFWLVRRPDRAAGNVTGYTLGSWTHRA